MQHDAATQVAALLGEQATTAAEFSQVRRDLADERARVSELAREVQVLERRTRLCVSRPATIDYASNAAVSSSLEAWLEDSFTRIDDSNWTVLWSGDRTASHELFFASGGWFMFLVYFEGDYDRNSTYDVFAACWLD
jgi:hypothetical protein